MKSINLAVGAIFKNEGPYLDEWINHYLDRGVEHFFLINDQSTDDSVLILEKYLKNVTTFNVTETINFNGRQEYLYNKFFSPLKEKVNWMLICDIDEYIWSPINKDMGQITKELESQNMRAFKIPMVLFGSNNHILQPKNIVKNFIKRIKVDHNYLHWIDRNHMYKTIFQLDEARDFRVHVPWTKSFCFYQNSIDLNKHYFRYNHYRLQSEEKWKEIILKSDVNNYIPRSASTLSPNIKPVNINRYGNYRTMELFYEANKVQNEIEDLDLLNQL
jgi:hypothetical protein